MTMARKRSRAKRKALTAQEQRKRLLAIDRGVVRAEQKAAGALDGRFREKKEENAKRYVRRPKHRGNDPDA